MRATMLFLAVMASITVIGEYMARAADVLDAMTTAAASKWKAQREGVVTGHFSIRLYRYTSLAYKQKIAAKEFRLLIDGKDASGVEAAIGKLQSLRGEMSIENSRPHWGVPIEISCEGIKWRNEWKGAPYSVYVFNGNEWVEYKAGISQATIIPGRPRLAAFSLDNLCNLPNASLVKKMLDSKDKRLVDGKVIIDFAKQRISFDPTTGFIDLHILTGPQNRLSEFRQVSPIQLEGGFVFPKAKIRAEYEGSYVRSFEVLLIDHAEVNRDVLPDAFVVSAPEKTTIVDTREKSENGYPNRVVKEAVPDVLAFANSGEVKRIPELQLSPQRSHARWLYALLTLPFVLLIAWSLARRWRAKMSNS